MIEDASLVHGAGEIGSHAQDKVAAGAQHAEDSFHFLRHVDAGLTAEVVMKPTHAGRNHEVEAGGRGGGQVIVRVDIYKRGSGIAPLRFGDADVAQVDTGDAKSTLMKQGGVQPHSA